MNKPSLDPVYRFGMFGRRLRRSRSNQRVPAESRTSREDAIRVCAEFSLLFSSGEAEKKNSALFLDGTKHL